jgi:hypothetical protein
VKDAERKAKREAEEHASARAREAEDRATVCVAALKEQHIRLDAQLLDNLGHGLRRQSISVSAQ